jgi:hypothetical protein
MAINTDAAALEAKYGGKTGAVQPAPMQDLYAPGVPGSRPTAQGQIPHGQPVPEGIVVQQVVGRGMAVVPPQQHVPNQPQMAVMPPQQTTRTSIGTIIEPSVSNPLTAKPPESPSGTAEPPKEAVKPKRPPLDLAKEILQHIWELGGEKSEEAQKFYDRGEDTLKSWRNRPAFIPLESVNRFLSRRPELKIQILDQLEPHLAFNGEQGWTESHPNRGKLNATICAPILDRPTLPFLWAIAHFMKKYEMGLQIQADTMINRSRNMLADRFLKSGVTWSIWIDGDMILPIGNRDWFRWTTGSTTIPDEYCAYDAIERLLSHNKPVVGGVYASRKWRGQLVCQPEIHPKDHQDKTLSNEIRRASAKGLHEVTWIGFGVAAVHREVFLEIQRRFPDLAPKTEFAPWGFFDTEPGDIAGEDEVFSRRARACSIPIWLDTQLQCGHAGTTAFMPENTAGTPTV